MWLVATIVETTQSKRQRGYTSKSLFLILCDVGGDGCEIQPSCLIMVAQANSQMGQCNQEATQNKQTKSPPLPTT